MSTLRVKYRPKTFDDFIGNKVVVKALQSKIKTEQTFLFYGEKGCGKTTLARLIARFHKIHKLDIYEIDSTSQSGVDDARSLKQTIHMSPAYSEKKIYIFDEAHRLSSHAQDALLKATEEPPEHVIFVFCTTNINKVVDTLKSRASKFEVKPLSRELMGTLLKSVLQKAKITLDEDVKKTIIKRSGGIPREALNMVDLVYQLKPKLALRFLKVADVKEDRIIIEICQILVRGKKGRWNSIRKLISELPDDPEGVRRVILRYLTKVQLDMENPLYILKIKECFLNTTYDNGMDELILQLGLASYI